MSDIEIIQENPLSLTELKDKIEEIKKREKELNFRSKKTEEYLKSLKIKDKKAKELKKELETLDILRLKPRNIIKIVDILPKDQDSLRFLLSEENITLKQEDITKIISIVKKHA